MPKQLRLIFVVLAGLAFSAQASAGIGCLDSLVNAIRLRGQPQYLKNLGVEGIAWRNAGFGWLAEGTSDWGKTVIISNENYTTVMITPGPGDLLFTAAHLAELQEQFSSLRFNGPNNEAVWPGDEWLLNSPDYFSLSLEKIKISAPTAYEDQSQKLLRRVLTDLPEETRQKISAATSPRKVSGPPEVSSPREARGPRENP